MDNTKSVLNLVTPNCFLCTIDLKDAYYGVKKFSMLFKLLVERKIAEVYVLPIMV